MTLDSRIRELHIARYGTTDEVEDYLRTLENLHGVLDDKRGENHHMLAQSIWVEYKSLVMYPWNRLRVSHAMHVALTELQGRFEERLQSAILLMKSQSGEAFLTGCRRGGKRMHEIHPDHSSALGKIYGPRTKERGVGIFAPENRSKGGEATAALGTGIFAMSPGALREAGRAGGKITSNRGIGLFALSADAHPPW